MKTGKPVWLPDWKDDNAYPRRVEDWNINQWMWAFIRRNEWYRADYAHFASLPYLEECLMEKWHIGNLPNPADDLGYVILTHLDDRPPERIYLDAPDVGGYVPPTPSPDESFQVTLRFDLRLNIDLQIARAREILVTESDRQKEGIDGVTDFKKERASAPKKSELIKYLRAFDARTVGAEYLEIGARLYPEKGSENSKDSMKQSANRAARAGRELVEGGYKALLNFAA